MSNIKIIHGVFDTKQELQHAGVKAGFPWNLKQNLKMREKQNPLKFSGFLVCKAEREG